MFNRIRVVTMLMMVLGVFALLQLVSGGLLFSSLQHNQQGFVISNELRQQQSERGALRQFQKHDAIASDGGGQRERR